MIKKTITYTDYNGLERTEDFYFNYNKAELMKMEMSVDGGFAERMQKIVNAKDAPTIMKSFEKFVLDAYGEKSDDGKRFIKTDELKEAFKQTEAFSIIFMELATNDEEAAKFVNGVVPADLAKQLANSGNATLVAPAN